VTAMVTAHRLAASGPEGVRALIGGPVRPARVLGAFPTALYVGLDGREVVAVLTRDSVRLPLGLVLATSSADQPLTRLTGPVQVGSGVVQVGAWRIHLARLTSVRAPTGLLPRGDAVERLARRLGDRRNTSVDPGLRLLPLLDVAAARPPAGVVDGLLGAGPGLTPAGDDVLAGYLVGGWCFGLDLGPLRAAVLEAAPTRTTDLSAALLRCASRGESIPQVDGLVRALTGDGPDATLAAALTALLEVGHSSGAALATGALAAARHATNPPAR
jgi:hypothetical protein